MQSILKKSSPGVANPLFRSKTPSPRTSPRIRVKDYIGTKKNAGTEGKLGRFKGKTFNNMFILEIEGKSYNFFRRDLDIVEEPKRMSPKHVSPLRTSPRSAEAERIADGFISGLDTSIADKVISAICRRRTSKTRKSPTKRSPLRVSPTKRKSPRKTICKTDEEISIKTGRCIKKCKDNQERNPETNRCVKRTSDKKYSPKLKPIIKIRSPSPTKSDIVVTDDDLIIEDDYLVRESPKRISPKRISPPKSILKVSEEESMYESPRVKRPTPRFIGTDDDIVTQFVTEEVEEGPFTDFENQNTEVYDDDLVIE